VEEGVIDTVPRSGCALNAAAEVLGALGLLSVRVQLALYMSPPSALVRPSKSATVTVSAECPLRRSADGTLSAK
jgi:hypothetical protein